MKFRQGRYLKPYQLMFYISPPFKLLVLYKNLKIKTLNYLFSLFLICHSDSGHVLYLGIIVLVFQCFCYLAFSSEGKKKVLVSGQLFF